jgi:hypothetical protein
MRAGLVGGIVVALCAWPAVAGAAPAVVLTAPDGSRVALQDAPQAVDLAKLAPVTVDRSGYTAPFAFCLQTLRPRERPGRGCENVPLPTLDDPVRIVEAGVHVGGVVAAAAATVEVVLTEGAPVRVAAQPGAYHGAYAGRVKFFLAAIPESEVIVRIRVFDAGGALIGGEGLENEQRLTKRVLVGRGRLAGGVRWTSLADTSGVAEPAAGAPERREERVCLSVQLTNRLGGTSVTGCRDPRRAAAGLLVSLPDCDTHRTVVAALLPPGARRASLVLGDGHRLRMATRLLSATQRAAAAAVPRGAAVRSLRVGGRVRALALAPATTACFNALSGRRLSGSGIPGPFKPDAGDLFPPPASPVPGAQPVAAAGGVPLFVAVRGDDVCSGLGRPPRSPDGCAPAPLRARQSRFAGRGRTVAVITAPTVSSVQLLAGGEAVASAPTVPAGAGRAAALEAPAGRDPLTARLIGADGHPLADVGLAPVAQARPRTVARGHGWIATATPILITDSAFGAPIPLSTTCLQVTGLPPRGLSEDCLDDGPGRVRVVATCRPRLVHVFGLGRRATLVLAGGRRRTAIGHHGAFHALLRRHERLRRVIEGRRCVRLRVPPPAEQCGYRAEALVSR